MEIDTALDECGKAIGISGTFNFNSMIADGFLDATGAAAHGMDYRFDNCSKTVGVCVLIPFKLSLKEA